MDRTMNYGCPDTSPGSSAASGATPEDDLSLYLALLRYRKKLRGACPATNTIQDDDDGDEVDAEEEYAEDEEDECAVEEDYEEEDVDDGYGAQMPVGASASWPRMDTSQDVSWLRRRRSLGNAAAGNFLRLQNAAQNTYDLGNATQTFQSDTYSSFGTSEEGTFNAPNDSSWWTAGPYASYDPYNIPFEPHSPPGSVSQSYFQLGPLSSTLTEGCETPPRFNMSRRRSPIVASTPRRMIDTTYTSAAAPNTTYVAGTAAANATYATCPSATPYGAGAQAASNTTYVATPQTAANATYCATPQAAANATYYTTPQVGGANATYVTPQVGGANATYVTPQVGGANATYITPQVGGANATYITPQTAGANATYCATPQAAANATYYATPQVGGPNATYVATPQTAGANATYYTTPQVGGPNATYVSCPPSGANATYVSTPQTASSGTFIAGPQSAASGTFIAGSQTAASGTFVASPQTAPNATYATCPSSAGGLANATRTISSDTYSSYDTSDEGTLNAPEDSSWWTAGPYASYDPYDIPFGPLSPPESVDASFFNVGPLSSTLTGGLYSPPPFNMSTRRSPIASRCPGRQLNATYDANATYAAAAAANATYAAGPAANATYAAAPATNATYAAAPAANATYNAGPCPNATYAAASGANATYAVPPNATFTNIPSPPPNVTFSPGPSSAISAAISQALQSMNANSTAAGRRACGCPMADH